MPVTSSLIKVAFGTNTETFQNLRAEGKRREAAAEASRVVIPITQEEETFGLYCFLLAVFGGTSGVAGLTVELGVGCRIWVRDQGRSRVAVHCAEVLGLWVVDAPLEGAQSLLKTVKTVLETATRPGAFLEGRKVALP